MPKKKTGNYTRIDPKESIVPPCDHSFPATEIKINKKGKVIYQNTEQNADYMREFCIENEK